MPSNVYNIPVYGKPIELDDQGVYCAVNRKTGGINNVFQLVYEGNEWFFYQLKNTGKNGEMGWVILADQGDYPLRSISTEEIKHHFSKPEYAEPKGSGSSCATQGMVLENLRLYMLKMASVTP